LRTGHDAVPFLIFLGNSVGTQTVETVADIGNSKLPLRAASAGVLRTSKAMARLETLETGKEKGLCHPLLLLCQCVMGLREAQLHRSNEEDLPHHGEKVVRREKSVLPANFKTGLHQ